MKWLYYTQANGYVSCLPFQNTLEYSVRLAPEDAVNFQVIDDEVEILPEKPIYKNDKYISDDTAKRESDRLNKKDKRKNSLSSLVANVNGKNIQVRESDELYLRRAIEAMEPLDTRKWIMADNSVDIVTREELVEALNIGLALGQSAFDEYIEWLENNQ